VVVPVNGCPNYFSGPSAGGGLAPVGEVVIEHRVHGVPWNRQGDLRFTERLPPECLSLVRLRLL